VRGTDNGDSAGILRIDFPGGAGEDALEHVGWDEWFGAHRRSVVPGRSTYAL
jgi:hypothetical protein